MINTGNSPTAIDSNEADSNHSASDINASKWNGSAKTHDDKVPIGLGSGLASLDSKKLKQTSKSMDLKKQQAMLFNCWKSLMCYSFGPQSGIQAASRGHSYFL